MFLAYSQGGGSLPRIKNGVYRNGIFNYDRATAQSRRIVPMWLHKTSGSARRGEGGCQGRKNPPRSYRSFANSQFVLLVKSAIVLIAVSAAEIHIQVCFVPIVALGRTDNAWIRDTAAQEIKTSQDKQSQMLTCVPFWLVESNKGSECWASERKQSDFQCLTDWLNNSPRLCATKLWPCLNLIN